jgi:hypothetical protein
MILPPDERRDTILKPVDSVLPLLPLYGGCQAAELQKSVVRGEWDAQKDNYRDSARRAE